MKRIVLIAALSPLFGCITLWGVGGNGHVVEEDRPTPDFEAVDLGGEIVATVHVGPKQAIHLIGDSNLLALLQLEVKDGCLQERFRGGAWVRPTQPIRIEISTPRLVALRSGGAAKIVVPEDIQNSDFEIEASGAGKIRLHSLVADDVRISASGAGEVRLALEAEHLTAEISGAASLHGRVRVGRIELQAGGGSDAQLEGEVEQLRLALSGGASVDAESLSAREVELDQSGGSGAKVKATRQVTGSLSGGAHALVRGHPHRQQVSTSGGSSVEFD